MRWFRLSLASWYGFALPHIDVAYDKQTHELREYRGLSNIRDAAGRNLSVTIRFPRSERRADVTWPRSSVRPPAADRPLHCCNEPADAGITGGSIEVGARH
jgi:hypothetical protein